MHSTECRVPENSKESQGVFLTKQCKEIEENSRMGKTRGLFSKTGDIKRIFHARMGMIKNKTDKNRTEQKQKRLRMGDKNTQNYAGKVLMSQINMMLWSLT